MNVIKNFIYFLFLDELNKTYTALQLAHVSVADEPHIGILIYSMYRATSHVRRRGNRGRVPGCPLSVTTAAPAGGGGLAIDLSTRASAVPRQKREMRPNRYRGKGSSSRRTHQRASTRTARAGAI